MATRGLQTFSDIKKIVHCFIADFGIQNLSPLDTSIALYLAKENGWEFLGLDFCLSAAMSSIEQKLNEIGFRVNVDKAAHAQVFFADYNSYLHTNVRPPEGTPCFLFNSPRAFSIDELFALGQQKMHNTFAFSSQFHPALCNTNFILVYNDTYEDLVCKFRKICDITFNATCLSILDLHESIFQRLVDVEVGRVTK